MSVKYENLNIGLDPESRQKIVNYLYSFLSNQFVLYVKSRNYHWNVVGINFRELHEFFKEIYEDLDEIIDDVAERIRSLGFFVPASMESFLKAATLHENHNEKISDREMLQDLLNDIETDIKDLRNIIDLSSKLGDEGTANFLTDILEKKEKTAWMIRASLE